jgi:putative selenate reductase
MSEKMTPIPFRSLMNWITRGYADGGDSSASTGPIGRGQVPAHLRREKSRPPFGPAAGPNSQLAQNIIAGYFAGARFFELKTVQKMDGAELAVHQPPLHPGQDECYNCEWSTELYVQQAFEEYVKAWCACKMLASSTAWATPTGSCSTCPWATTWRASGARRSTASSTA